MSARARTYRFGKSSLTLCFGDLTTSHAQALVNSQDTYISMAAGVGAALLAAGGESIAIEAAKKVPAAVGDVVITSAGSLPAQYVFHAITLGSSDLPPGDIVTQTTRRCMQLVDHLGLSSIAFPAIGAGMAGFPYEEVAARMADVIVDSLVQNKRAIDVTLFLHDHTGNMTELDFIRFFEEFAARAPKVASHLSEPTAAPASPAMDVATVAVQTEEEWRNLRVHNIRRALASLEEQRGKLEQRLIGLLETAEAVHDQGIRSALNENQELRLQYLAELRSLSAQTGQPQPGVITGPPRVFLSSTSADLKPHREAVRDAISRCDLLFRGMEHFGADPSGSPPATVIVDEVRRADIYVGLFGVRYGSIDAATGLSMTELEFREAEAHKKPMLLYVIDEDAPVSVAHIEKDPESYRKLTDLKQHILAKYVPYLFRSVQDLARQVYADLQKVKPSSSDG